MIATNQNRFTQAASRPRIFVVFPLLTLTLFVIVAPRGRTKPQTVSIGVVAMVGEEAKEPTVARLG